MSENQRRFYANKYIDSALVLSDGDFWVGKGVGSKGVIKGELCFNVSMTGYQEIMTDPSYSGQIITFAFPHIGNVGCNTEDFESQQAFCKGVVMRESITSPSNFRAKNHLKRWLESQKVVGLSEVDTRALVRNIRKKGPRSALIYHGSEGEDISIDSLWKKVKDYPTLNGQDLATSVSTLETYDWSEEVYQLGQDSYQIHKNGKYHVIVIDFGVKKNILRCLVHNDCKVSVVSCLISIDDLLKLKPDGILLSNGPGDPFATFDKVRSLIEGVLELNIPLFGICLGNQLLALASGLNTLKLSRGHRGSNHPVKNLKTGQVEITSQNHGFCVSHENVPEFIEVTHTSLFDGTIEGIRRKDKPAFAIQYHPESSPGPHDSHYLFKQFYKMIHDHKRSS